MFGIPMVPRVVSGGCGEVTATRTIRYSRIAVLVAVAIPVFSAQLEKSREAVDLANVRSAYAVLQIAKNEETLPDGTKDFNVSPPKSYFFYTGNGFIASADLSVEEIKRNGVRMTSNGDGSALSDYVAMPNEQMGLPNVSTINGCYLISFRSFTGDSDSVLTLYPPELLEYWK